ncbi:MAG TPA: AAA family ATPase [Solirubrobacteraceae bacterium]|nr:AAA family ATPase [Solirubrobacteraceae bacterium]
MSGEVELINAPADADERAALNREWHRLGRVATFVALLTSPVLFTILHHHGWSVGGSAAGTVGGVLCFRGLIDLGAHKLLPRPSLYGASRDELLDDATGRRRWWFWSGMFRLAIFVAIIWGLTELIAGKSPLHVFHGSGLNFALVLQVMLLFIINIGVFMGPLMFAGISQIKGYEPGDADWGVRLEDVRGQAEPKEEVSRVISLWQSGEAFRKAGGKPERGLLFIGAPGTGKTMLSKAIATSFNAPIVMLPGSGFAQTFIGVDVLVVRYMMRKARKLARKWGGQCIIFIDEIDAVGLRRQALGSSFEGFQSPLGATSGVGTIHDHLFFGSNGAMTASGDVVLQTREWRERMFAARAAGPTPSIYGVVGEKVSRFMFPGGMGGGMGQMALQQLLVQMDGVDQPRFGKRIRTKMVNTLLDATYVVPRKIGDTTLRLPPAPPRPEQLYFIGATNVPIDALDPALIRPGRMGRHIWFRTPTKDDRLDIIDLYMAKVDHDPELDTERRRDELARLTNGYSPAMIEQVCSMALTYAHSDGRQRFEWGDIIEAMTTIESGTAQGIDYVAEETRAVAIHEAGHAVASHVYEDRLTSIRLSIRKRGGSLGHHYATEKEERFSSWRHELTGRLVCVLGAMAAEHVFYGENSSGVGGDVQAATTLAAWMVGMCGMGPEPVELNGRWKWADEEERREQEKRVMERFEEIGTRIMNRARGMSQSGDSIAAILSDRSKGQSAARIIGQAYITASCLIRHNREKVLQVAEVLIERRELHGDEVVAVLDAAKLEAPVIDLSDETIWPRL